MPQALGRTRSDTLRQTTLRIPLNDPKRKRTMPAAQNQDVIELSSDEDARPPARKKTASRRKPTAAATAEVLEISDSDDLPSKTRPSTSKVDASAATAQRVKSLRSVCYSCDHFQCRSLIIPAGERRSQEAAIQAEKGQRL
jgi:hypothetical protein